MMNAALMSFGLLACLTVRMCAAGLPSQVGRALSEALAKEDPIAIRAAVDAGRTALGPRAGEPEVADKYLPIPKNATWLTPAEAQPGFSKEIHELERLRWWRIGLDPTKLTQPLRAPASFIMGNIAVVRAKLDGAERSLALAKEAGDFLIWTQQQGGTGVFPFPAARGGKGGKAFESAERFLSKAEKTGARGDLVRNGWAVDDGDDGGLQFDNGECGVAMFELYELTHEPKYLESARTAADWAAARKLVANWNYNSFSVWLLAKAYTVTREKCYLDAATKKALLGVIPGQMTDGPRAGRWLDPHNARPAYHYIMLRALAQLAVALPKEDASHAEVMRALQLGLHERNQEFITRGVPTKDKAMQTLLLVARVFADDGKFLHDSGSTVALDALAKLVSDQFRRGGHPLSPGEWGSFIEFVATQPRGK